MLRQFFGTKWVKMTFTSTVPGSVPHTYYNVDQLVDEIIMARVYGGMHYPTSAMHGAIMGRKVGQYVGDHYFRRAY